MAEDRRPIPPQIDTLRDYCPEGRTRPDYGYEGGKEWHPSFERYMRHVLPTSVIEARRRQREWWRNSWTVSQVRLLLHEKHGVRDGNAILETVLSLYQEPREPYFVIARRTHQSVGSLIAHKVEVLRLVRQFQA